MSASFDTSARASQRLQVLVGLPMSVTRRAANIRGFHFGPLRGSSGTYLLHIQCAWRLEQEGAIVTGSGDLYRPASAQVPADDWYYEDGNLQDARLSGLLDGDEILVEALTRSRSRADDA